ncbi:Imm10 family immunity protein [Paractinoplanes toevensis]|nr:Imm10 family immunity protein [Actinoplanes toevensis]
MSRNADIAVVSAAAVELPDVETYCVAMATDEYGEQFGLTFQVPLSGEYDEQDRRLGMDTYSISNHLGRSIYGGIIAIAADPGASVLTMTFSTEATEELDIPATLRFHLANGKFDQVVEGLRRVLAEDGLRGSLP